MIKGACSETFGKWILFKLTDKATFSHQYIIHGGKKTLQICIFFQVIRENNIYVIYCLIEKVVATSSIFWEAFHWFLENYTDFVQETSHITLAS